MSYRVSTQVYSGPFDLLLQLVTRQKVDIGAISISEVAEQYLAEAERIEALDLDVASDFLLVAATLLDIKAASLVPQEAPRKIDVDDGEFDEDLEELSALDGDALREVLIQRLIAYKQFKGAAAALGARMQVESRMHPRVAGPDPEFLGLMPDYLAGITLRGLAVICADLDGKRQTFLLEAEHVAPHRVPLDLTVASVDRFTMAHQTCTFRELLDGDATTEQLVVTFLAMLELAKRGSLTLSQDEIFHLHQPRRGRRGIRTRRGPRAHRIGAATMSTLSTLEANSLKGALEALLLVSSDPVSAPALAGALDIAPGECASLLAELKVEYEEANRGFQLREVAGGWRLFTHPAYHDVVEAYVLSWDTQKLSQAALETLAVIAYHQPVTREVVKGIRGVNSDGVIASLVDKGLVRELGRDPQRGQAIIYGTTNAFLEKFGLRSTRDLPDLEQFAPDEQSRQFIRERLSGRSIQSTLEEQAEDLDEERELLDTDVEDVEAVEDLETLAVDETSEDLHDED